ncbi:MAG: hypothetical protein K5643_04965 [Saccharofermentans sp.]|nr:hypothetical protein [Saccharofermentans sp.]
MYLIQAWIGTDYQFAYNEMFYILLPVLACLPYGGSLYTDIKTGYDKNICIKGSRLHYAISKGIATFLSAFFSVAIPLGLNLFIAAGLFSNYSPERLEWMNIGIVDRNMFTTIFISNPAVYCLVYILIDGLFAGAIALTSLSLSKVVKSHFTAVVTPMVLYVLFAMFMEGNDFGNWSVLGMLNPRQYVVTKSWQMITAFLVILFINVFIIWVTSRKRDVL